MKRIEKGSYGYRNYHFLRNAMITALIAFAIALQIAAGRRLGGTASIVLTLTGILCVLPLANVLSPLIALMKYRTPDRSLFDTLQPYRDRGILLFDLVFTTKEKAFPADACLIRSGAILCLAPLPVSDRIKLKEHLERSLRLEHLKFHVNLYEDTEQFRKAVEQLPAEPAPDAAEQKAEALFKNISF